MAAPLALPQPLDIVAAADVEPFITTEHADLARLRIEAGRLQDEASQVEVRLDQERVDPKVSVWMTLRFRSFLLALRSEAERECEAHLALARSEAERIRRGGHARLDISFVSAIGVPSARWL